jgi:PAS domain S-box-containing protein
MFWDHPHAVALLDPQGRIVCNNPAFRRLVGSISDAIAGTLFLALFPPSEADRVTGYLAASLRFETQPDLVTRITPPDGSSVDVVLTPIPAQACGHAGLFVVVREVTGLLSAERAIARHMSIGDLNRLTLQSQLSMAIQRNELVLHYQPVVDLLTGSVRSIEALVRWQHRTLGLLAPGTFIGLAEQNGSIIELGDWVLRTACADAVRLRQAAQAPISVAVNLSARQFELKDLAKRVGCILETAGLEPRSLRLELTETVVMSNPDDSRASLSELSAMGISLALDDFGTGYSSLGYLQQFPLHCLKIDRSFVSGVPGNERSEAITRAVVVLGKALHMTVVAEGVETLAQLDFLRNLDCDEVQGYLVSTPLPYDQLVKWLADRANETF